MKYVFLIAAEHQLTQVRIAITHFKLQRNQIILVVMDLHNDAYISKLTPEEFPTLVTFKNWTFKTLLQFKSSAFAFIAYCKNLKLIHQNFYVFYSQYGSDPDLLLNAILKPEKTYLMDEGTASFTVVDNRKKRPSKRLHLFIKRLIYRVPIFIPKELTFFTQYQLPINQNDTIEKYNVKKINNALGSFRQQQVAFLGSSIVELNMMQRQVYFQLLKIIKDYFPLFNIIYYPHRKESQEKLAHIVKLGFQIEKQSEPFENKFGKNYSSEAIVASFHTTSAILALSRLYENLPALFVFKFNQSFLLYGADVYENILQDFQREQSIKIIPI